MHTRWDGGRISDGLFVSSLCAAGQTKQKKDHQYQFDTIPFLWCNLIWSAHVLRGVEQPGDGRHLFTRLFTGEVSPSRRDSCKQKSEEKSLNTL